MFSLFGKLKSWIVAASVAALAALGVYLRGRSDARQRAAEKDAQDYRDTRRRMDEADDSDSVDAARGWLHDRGKSDRDL